MIKPLFRTQLDNGPFLRHRPTCRLFDKRAQKVFQMRDKRRSCAEPRVTKRFMTLSLPKLGQGAEYLSKH